MSLFLRDLIRVKKAEEEVKPELSLDIGVELIKGTRRGEGIQVEGTSPAKAWQVVLLLQTQKSIVILKKGDSHRQVLVSNFSSNFSTLLSLLPGVVF